MDNIDILEIRLDAISPEATTAQQIALVAWIKVNMPASLGKPFHPSS